MYRVVTPQTAAELGSYYQLRWEALVRKLNEYVGAQVIQSIVFR